MQVMGKGHCPWPAFSTWGNQRWAMGNGWDGGRAAKSNQSAKLPTWRKSTLLRTFKSLRRDVWKPAAGIRHVESFEENNFTQLNSLRGND